MSHPKSSPWGSLAKQPAIPWDFTTQIRIARMTAIEGFCQHGPTDYDSLNQLVSALKWAPGLFATTYFDSKLGIVREHYESIELDSNNL